MVRIPSRKDAVFFQREEKDAHDGLITDATLSRDDSKDRPAHRGIITFPNVWPAAECHKTREFRQGRRRWRTNAKRPKSAKILDPSVEWHYDERMSDTARSGRPTMRNCLRLAAIVTFQIALQSCSERSPPLHSANIKRQ
jgi:hypothetical protein